MSLTTTVTNPKTIPELVRQIREHILRDVEDARMRELAAHVINTMKVPQRSPRLLARAFQLFSQKQVQFFREYPEFNAAPWITAKWRIGDCDDKSRLIAALLKSFRIPVRLAVVTFEPSNAPGKMLSHVWPEAFVDGKWEALESVREWPMGKSALDAIRAKGLKHTHFTVVV